METINDKGAKVSLNSIKSLFCDTYNMYQERFAVLTEIALLPVLIMILGYALIFLGGIFSVLGILVIAVGVVALLFSSIAMVFSVHHNTDVDASYRATTKFFWPVVWMSILSFLAFLGGSIMLIIPAIWLAIAVSLKSYTLIIENRRGIDGLRQSKEYIRGYWWAVFGRTILFLILVGIIAIILHVPFSLFGTLGINIASSILSLFILPLSTIFFYKIYQNLRTLKPELHEAKHVGGGFITVAAIIGLVIAILFGCAIVVGIVVGIRDGSFTNANSMNNSIQYSSPYSQSNQ